MSLNKQNLVDSAVQYGVSGTDGPGHTAACIGADREVPQNLGRARMGARGKANETPLTLGA